MIESLDIKTILLGSATLLGTTAIKKAENPARAIDDLMTLIGFEKLHEIAEISTLLTETILFKN